MNRVFLDTSGLVALVNADDQWNDIAESAWAELTTSSIQLVTCSLILIEVADGLSRVQHRQLAVQLVDALKVSSRVEILAMDEQLEATAWRLFRDRKDKDWGMTDCVSMSLMTNLEIRQAFTADHHFEQAGFEILLTK